MIKSGKQARFGFFNFDEKIKFNRIEAGEVPKIRKSLE
jgi:hypothetical protein